MSIARFSTIALLVCSLVACNTVTTSTNQILPGIGVNITSTSCPSSIVKIGDQVTWTNNDQSEHIVQAKASDGNSIFDSGTLQPKDTFAFVFSQAGIYEYICSPNGDLTGAITVEP